MSLQMNMTNADIDVKKRIETDKRYDFNRFSKGRNPGREGRCLTVQMRNHLSPVCLEE